MKTIVFPVNNKGGVGKTSILTDLSSAIAQRHRVGILDTDHQASLAGTLLGNKDLSCRDLPYYDQFGVSEVTLMPGTSLNFNNGLSWMGLDIMPTRARVAVFPVGVLYDHPEKRKKLEQIIGAMSETDILMVDLPPLPHPGMVLDYTVKPLIEICGGDVALVPLVVSTPEHNVVEIGLRQFESVESYLMSIGIHQEQVSPVSVLNKLLLDRDEDGEVGSNLDTRDIRKLRDLGMLYVSSENEHYAQMNHFAKKFKFEDRTVRSVVFPFLDEIRDGRFSLLWGEPPELHFFPHLVDLVKGNHFSVSSMADPIKRVYMFALRELTNYVASVSGVPPRRNYLKKTRVFDKVELTNKTTRELREILGEFYGGLEIRYTETVTKPQYGSSAENYFSIPKTLTLEQMAQVLFRTARMLGTSEVRYEEVLTDLRGEEGNVMRPGEYELRDPSGMVIVHAHYHTYDRNRIVLGFVDHHNDWYARHGGFDTQAHLPKIDLFLKNLESEL